MSIHNKTVKAECTTVDAFDKATARADISGDHAAHTARPTGSTSLTEPEAAFPGMRLSWDQSCMEGRVRESQRRDTETGMY